MTCTKSICDSEQAIAQNWFPFGASFNVALKACYQDAEYHQSLASAFQRHFFISFDDSNRDSNLIPLMTSNEKGSIESNSILSPMSSVLLAFLPKGPQSLGTPSGTIDTWSGRPSCRRRETYKTVVRQQSSKDKSDRPSWLLVLLSLRSFRSKLKKHLCSAAHKAKVRRAAGVLCRRASRCNSNWFPLLRRTCF